jgi:solute carrier family 25 protein 38
MEYILAGGGAGFLTCILLQPLDVLKTRAQQAHNVPPLLRPKNPTVMSFVSSWWSGIGPTLFRAVPGVSFYFFTLNQTQKRSFNLIQKNHGIYGMFYDRISGHPKPLLNFLTGATSRFFATLVTMPLTVVKTRMESTIYGGKYKSTFYGLKTIYMHEGFSALFRGFPAVVLRDVPHAGIYLVLYEHFKNSMDAFPISQAQIPTVAAGVAASLATWITHPADVIKSRLQLAQKGQYKSTWHCFTRMLLDEPNLIRSMYSGILPRWIRKSTQATITWTLYEFFIARVKQ